MDRWVVFARNRYPSQFNIQLRVLKETMRNWKENNVPSHLKNLTKPGKTKHINIKRPCVPVPARIFCPLSTLLYFIISKMMYKNSMIWDIKVWITENVLLLNPSKTSSVLALKTLESLYPTVFLLCTFLYQWNITKIRNMFSTVEN